MCRRAVWNGHACPGPPVASRRPARYGVRVSAQEHSPARARSPLWLLARVNLLQLARRGLAVGRQSPLLTAVIGVFIVGYVVSSFWLFHVGLMFLGRFPGLGLVLVERLLYLLFAFLFALLLLSNLIISYTNLFRNREAAFLLSAPVRAETIFRWKFLESVVLASWAFVFLIAPLLAAFGLTRQAAWHFYPLTVGLVGLFIVLPGVAGAWCAIQLALYLDRRTFQFALLMAAGAALLLARFYWRAVPVDEENLEMRVLPVLDNLLVKTRLALFPFLPSYWLARGVLDWTEGARASAGLFMLVLLAYVVFFGCLAFTRLGRPFYAAASAVQSRAAVWKRGPWWQWLRARQRDALEDHPGVAERFLARWARWLSPDCRALLVKDARVFWRDTTQWGQSVMLFGLLGVYIINLRHFTSQLGHPFWVNLVSYLNLGACALNLATLTTRFVYPQFSLEGQRLWIVGLAPMGLARLVWIKYWLAISTSLAVTLGLMLLSGWMLNLSWDRTVYFGAVVTVMTFTLNGLAAGLGVLYPNFRENNPGKIVSGFGGTLCLVLSFFYILGAVLLLAWSGAGLRSREASPPWALAGTAAFAAMSLGLGWLPLRLALRRLPRLEF